MIGILGVAAHFPSEVRTNEWWPAELVTRWMDVRANQPPPTAPPGASEGVARVIAAMIENARDPFQGTRERRVIAQGDSVFDLEEHAARLAIERAQIDPQTIDLLVTYTLVPDVMLSNPASNLHRRLGLSPRCLTFHTDAAGYSFLAQLAIAEGLIASGRVRTALLAQSSVATRHAAIEDPGSVLLGDGAAAVVVGEVGASRGIIGAVHSTDGRFPNSFVMSVPGKPWYDDGRPLMHVADPHQMRQVFLATADVCKDSVDAVLAKTGYRVADLDFLCVFQGTAWLRRVVHDYLGVGDARCIDTFSRFGYMSAAMIPVNLYIAETEGALRDGDLVALTGGGTGVTYGATLLRWGRG